MHPHRSSHTLMTEIYVTLTLVDIGTEGCLKLAQRVVSAHAQLLEEQGELGKHKSNSKGRKKTCTALVAQNRLG